MSDELQLPEAIENFRMPLWGKLLIALPAIGFPVVILLFILRNEVAHDESRCPYRALVTERFSEQIDIVEERRSCVDGVEDRRYSVRRKDSMRVLGTRRLPPSAFTKPEYRWIADMREGQMHLKVMTKGHATAEFREGTDKERSY